MSEFKWDEEMVLKFADLCHHEGRHRFHGALYIPTLMEEFKESKEFYSNTRTVKADESNNVWGSEDWKVTEYKLGDNTWKVEDFGKTWIIDNAKMEIHSVKRLSDGEVFSIGDEIIFDNIPFQIEGFSVEFDKLLHVKIKHNGIVDISSLQKQKPILFTSEDGKNIYHGDKYYWVNTSCESYWEIFESEDIRQWDCNSSIIKYFSTEEAANTYIFHKKYCLNFDDVHKLFQENYSISLLYAALKELVKSKINK